ncbi:hypothetical protein [Kitasatospora sp. SUK 42]|uniref:hypothetical protein n=1 Tax=Kitasatospora sp. SUK 42 TaxID=1588882 RepID=UPI0018CBA6A0|nr:hypothetical protein [Kitasatospora sp. SUK 42]MBV2154724.1 acyl-CoA dehydrogenase family protein [Kitasatospora sp. SUK 42]
MTVPAEVREHWREARVSARNDGLVPALTLLSRALSPSTPPRGPRGHAVVPRELLVEYREFADRGGYGERTGTSAPAEPDGHRPDSHQPDSHRPGPEAEPADPLPGLAVLGPATTAQPLPGPDPDAWGAGLAWLRLGNSERLREACVAYLATRKVEGTSLLLQQLVKGALADALIEQLEIEGVLDYLTEDAEETGPDGCSPLAPALPLDPPALARLQAQITEVDRALLRLLGAYGFTAEGPGQAAYASELLADVYCGWPGPAQHSENDRNTPEGTV